MSQHCPCDAECKSVCMCVCVCVLPGYISSVQGLVRPVGWVGFAVHTEQLLRGRLEVIQPGETAC